MFVLEVQLPVAMYASCYHMLSLGPSSSPCSSSLLLCALQDNRWWLKKLVPCHPSGRLGPSSWPLVSFPTGGHCRHWETSHRFYAPQTKEIEISRNVTQIVFLLVLLFIEKNGVQIDCNWWDQDGDCNPVVCLWGWRGRREAALVKEDRSWKVTFKTWGDFSENAVCILSDCFLANS